jgi:hypothetical protein
MSRTVAGSSCGDCGAATDAPGLCERCYWRVIRSWVHHDNRAAK